MQHAVGVHVLERLADLVEVPPHGPLGEALPALDVPLCILVAGSGSPDDDAERERGLALAEVLARRTAAGMPAAHVVRYPGAGHNLMRYRPGPVAAELLVFAERVAAARQGAGAEG